MTRKQATGFFADQGDGEPLLLVHGFPLDHSMWRAQLDFFSASRRVIAPDLRGFGRGPALDEDTLTMEQLADDLAALLDALQITSPVDVCGLSMGGYVAWQFWKRHRPRLKRLIQCDTRAEPDSPEAAQARLQNAERVLQDGVDGVVDGMLPKMFAAATLSDRADVVSSIRAVMAATAPRTVAAALRGMAAREDFRPYLPRLDLPTLLICGAHDAISTADEMRSVAQEIPGARFVEIAAAGHMAPCEDPAAVNQALVAFLARPN